MLQRKIAVGLILLITISVSLAYLIFQSEVNKRRHHVDSSLKEVRNLLDGVKDIHDAKNVLESNGFKIFSGPEFSVYDKSYYSMVVDFGVRPNRVERLFSIFDIELTDEKFFGLIKANRSGEIFSIE